MASKRESEAGEMVQTGGLVLSWAGEMHSQAAIMVCMRQRRQRAALQASVTAVTNCPQHCKEMCKHALPRVGSSRPRQQEAAHKSRAGATAAG